MNGGDSLDVAEQLLARSAYEYAPNHPLRVEHGPEPGERYYVIGELGRLWLVLGAPAASVYAHSPHAARPPGLGQDLSWPFSVSDWASASAAFARAVQFLARAGRGES